MNFKINNYELNTIYDILINFKVSYYEINSICDVLLYDYIPILY